MFNDVNANYKHHESTMTAINSQLKQKREDLKGKEMRVLMSITNKFAGLDKKINKELEGHDSVRAAIEEAEVELADRRS